MTSKILFLALIILLLFSCQLDPNKLKTNPDPAQPTLRFIDEYIIPYQYDFGGTMVGGLSGIDFDGVDTYYLICDDAMQYGKARFYKAKIDFNDTSIISINCEEVVILKQEDGVDYPSIKEADSIFVDPEAIRVDLKNGKVIWTSEGFGVRKLMDPLVLVHDLKGNHIMKHKMPVRYRMSADKTGPRHNGTFEGITLEPGGRHAWVSTELALKQDGPVATYDSAGAPLRFFKMDLKSGEIVKESPYPLEKLFAPLDSGIFGMTGVVELLWLDHDRFLVLERAYIANLGNKVRLFLVDFSEATDILAKESLIGQEITLPKKRLLLDFDSLPLSKVDNIEGFSWGKPLHNGNPTLIFVSDDNFGEDQVTQFILFEITAPL